MRMTPSEVKDWKPTIEVRALSSRVLIVAKTRIEGTWAAYCDAVPGVHHNLEYEQVLAGGDKIGAEIARILFPVFADLPYSQ